MNKIFITYGDDAFEKAKKKIIHEAIETNQFNKTIAYGRNDLSSELLNSKVIKIKRGGGLWSWKPDVLLTTIDKSNPGDIIVYCDSGCSLFPSKEWSKIFKKLDTYDIYAQRIFQRTDNWTRHEIIEYFQDNRKGWTKSYQYLATIIILRVSSFTRSLIKEWRDLMVEHPEFAMDVVKSEQVLESPGFIENRHDQAIFSALIYKYLNDSNTASKIYTKWEHIEDQDIINKQAIRATRLRLGQEESKRTHVKKVFKRLIKDYIYKPFYYSPLQWWYNRK